MLLTGFFDDYLSNIGKYDGDGENLSIYLNWKRLLFKDSYLILDMNEDSYEKQVKNNPMYLYLEKSSQSGGSKVSLSPDILNKFEKEGTFGEFFSPIYIIEDESEKFKSKYGETICVSI